LRLQFINTCKSLLSIQETKQLLPRSRESTAYFFFPSRSCEGILKVSEFASPWACELKHEAVKIYCSARSSLPTADNSAIPISSESTVPKTAQRWVLLDEQDAYSDYVQHRVLGCLTSQAPGMPSKHAQDRCILRP